MVANPFHGEGQGVFVATFRRHIQEVVNAQQDVQPASVGGVCMEDVAFLVFVKHAQAGRFIAGKVLHLVVVSTCLAGPFPAE